MFPYYMLQKALYRYVYISSQCFIKPPVTFISVFVRYMPLTVTMISVGVILIDAYLKQSRPPLVPILRKRIVYFMTLLLIRVKKRLKNSLMNVWVQAYPTCVHHPPFVRRVKM